MTQEYYVFQISAALSKVVLEHKYIHSLPCQSMAAFTLQHSYTVVTEMGWPRSLQYLLSSTLQKNVPTPALD